MNTDFQREFVQKWMYKTSLQPTTKINWHYLRWLFDTEATRNFFFMDSVPVSVDW